MKPFHLALALFLGLALAQTHDPLDPAQFSALPEGYSVRLLAGAEEVREATLLQGGRAWAPTALPPTPSAPWPGWG
jgi:cyclomaltodextrinase